MVKTRYKAVVMMLTVLFVSVLFLVATPQAYAATGGIEITVAAPGDEASVSAAITEAEAASGVAADAMTEVTVQGVELQYSGIRALSRYLTAMEILHMPDQLNLSYYFVYPNAFHYNSTLKEVDMPSLRTIGAQAFSDCSELVTINLPSVTTVESTDTFSSCPKLTSVNLPELTSVSGISNSFRFDVGLSSVSLPKITSLGERHFNGCATLANVSLPRLTTIGNFAFQDCTDLSRITLPASVTSVGNRAFENTTMTDIVFLGETPPVFGAAVFGNVASTTTIWVVNDSAKAAYETTLVPSVIPNTSQIKVLSSGEYPTDISVSSSEMTLYVGQTHNLTAAVAGAPVDPSYGWTSSDNEVVAVTGDGKVIATNAGTATITATCAMDNTKTASCVVTVLPAPTITAQPTDRNINVGDTATFTVATTDAVSYQWQESNDDGASWADVVTGTGGTEASYTIATAVIEDNGKQFRCVVSNPAGTVTSDTAVLTVTDPPTPTPSYSYIQLPSKANDYTAICDGSYGNLLGVYVDNVLLDSNHYDAWEGSTYVKLSARYIATLNAGSHTLTLQYTDGSVSDSFTVTKADVTPDDNTPSGDKTSGKKLAPTGDNLIGVGSLTILSAAVALVAAFFKRRRT